MKKFLFLNAAIFMTCFAFAESRKPNIEYIDMLIGSTGAHKTEYGGTTPAVGTPFAMTQWCAATRENGVSKTSYHYKDQACIGFIATHQPAIWMGDFCFFTLMPQCGTLKIDNRGEKFSREDETATPYYYKLSYGNSPQKTITTEMTATSRCGFFRISYPKSEKAILLFEVSRGSASSQIEFLPEKNEIKLFNSERHDRDLGPELKNLKGFYLLKFSAKISNFGIIENGEKKDARKCASSGKLFAFAEFEPLGNPLEIRIASSFISEEQAKSNLEKEMPPRLSFEEIAKKTKKSWEKYLNKIEIEGGSEDEKTVFYTSFMRTLQYPREFSEYGKYYSPFDDKIHDGNSYNAYSLWDTFRAEHPWLQIAAPERVSEMMQALVQMYKEGGWLPKWPNPSYTNIMIGTHADAVIADAFVNGFRDFDVKTAYEAVRKDATTPPNDDLKHRWGDRDHWKWGGFEGRGGLTHYIEKGYVSCDFTNESASRTLEFSLDDYCVAQMAKLLGKKSDYERFIKQSKNYKNIFNPETKFFHAKKSDGSFHENWGEGFTETSNWNYRFCAMQDVEGLVELMGGRENFVKALDDVFDGGHYAHDNEPSHHYAYLYNYAGRYDKTRLRVSQIRDAHYKNKPDGLSGNDDCGQMSAWYLFSCLGFYPVTPASGIYALGVPKFKSAKIKLSAKKTLEISLIETGESQKNVYLNGKKLNSPFIKVKDVLNGGKLVFEK